MRAAYPVGVVAAVLLAAGTACDATEADVAACKAAMAEAFEDVPATGDAPKLGPAPAACDRVDDETLRRLWKELTAEYGKGGGT
ncbi:hypothetical protein [Streptomyces sp. NPDC059909]|uniref:hypothetical protein n=1 Tax=Streptomyces sp. NPDC059909 TaxID=3346998 RepID=UPI00365FF070